MFGEEAAALRVVTPFDRSESFVERLREMHLVEKPERIRSDEAGSEFKDVVEGRPDLLVTKTVHSAFHGTPDLHVNFKLSKTGESIGLYGGDGVAVDYVNYGAQSDDVSEGRYPDVDGRLDDLRELPAALGLL